MIFRELKIGDQFFFKCEIGENYLLKKISIVTVAPATTAPFGSWEIQDRLNEDVVRYN